MQSMKGALFRSLLSPAKSSTHVGLKRHTHLRKCASEQLQLTLDCEQKDEDNQTCTRLSHTFFFKKRIFSGQNAPC